MLAHAERPQYTLESLLRFCDGGASCALEALDYRPDDDLLVQLSRCETWSGRHTFDCSGHAIQRWLVRRPDGAELARVAGVHGPSAVQLGDEIGAYVACQGDGICPGEGLLHTRCEAAAAPLRAAPERCGKGGRHAMDELPQHPPPQAIRP